MCGICGLAWPGGARPPERGVLAAQAGALAHRGPDGEGFFVRDFEDGGGVGLGHRRLAIIDLATGDQPLSNEDGSIWIVFNGEIYNFPELRRELEARGHVFRTRSDTEAIVHLYEDLGPGCLDRLRGMFALAIHDGRDRSLFLARDRFGKKPLYYATVDGALVFGSEPKAVLAHPAFVRRPDLNALGLYLSLQYLPDPLTAFEGLRSLPPASWLSWRDGRLETRRWWRLDFEPKWTASEDDLAAELRELVIDATRARLVSDVPLGAHLSGGVDSSIITGVMAGLRDEPVRTFSIGFAEEAFSETAKARAVAARYGCRHREFLITHAEALETLDAVVAACDAPLADPAALALWHLSRLTREEVTVALCGDGGDELFAGYQRLWLDPLADAYARLPGWLTGRFAPFVAGLLPEPKGRPIEANWVAGIKRLGQAAAIPRSASIVRWGSYFTPEAARRLMRPEFRAALVDDAAAWLGRVFAEARASNDADRTLWCDAATYLPGDLLVKADRMTMAHALEGRAPLLDHVLAEWAARLPVGCKVRGRTGKYLLRKAFADMLPPRIAGQGKRGFGLPVGAWFSGPLKAVARERLLGGRLVREWLRGSEIERLLAEHAAGRVDHGKRLYALLMLDIWFERYL